MAAVVGVVGWRESSGVEWWGCVSHHRFAAALLPADGDLTVIAKRDSPDRLWWDGGVIAGVLAFTGAAEEAEFGHF